MKQQLDDLKEETKRKEQRWTASAARLRERVESLEKEKSELKVKMEELEKVNAAQKHVWKQVEASSKQSVTQVCRHILCYIQYVYVDCPRGL